jgi:hypothetical protein
MVRRKSGTVMTVTALPSRIGKQLNGGYTAASEICPELAPRGIRVVTMLNVTMASWVISLSQAFIGAL